MNKEITSPQSGFILITTLALAMIFSGLLVLLIKSNFSFSQNVRVAEHVFEGRILAKSAIRRVFVALQDPTDDFENNILHKQQPFLWRFSEKDIELSIVSESGKIDINNSAPILIRRYAENSGAASAHVAALMERVQKSRADGERLNLEDIYWPMLGYTSWAAFHDDFTVRNPRGTINFASASRTVLNSIPDLSPQQVNQLQNEQADRATNDGLISSKFRGPSGDIFTISARVIFSKSRSFSMRMPIQVFSSGEVRALNIPHI